MAVKRSMWQCKPRMSIRNGNRNSHRAKRVNNATTVSRCFELASCRCRHLPIDRLDARFHVLKRIRHRSRNLSMRRRDKTPPVSSHHTMWMRCDAAASSSAEHCWPFVTALHFHGSAQKGFFFITDMCIASAYLSIHLRRCYLFRLLPVLFQLF